MVINGNAVDAVEEFNNNIRCIEISPSLNYCLDTKQFNNNIRCIEIFVVKPRPDNRLGLITT